MNKRRYEDDEAGDNYFDIECPQCEAPLRVRFPRGRQTRRLRCEVCQQLVTLTRPPAVEEQPKLVQLQWKSK